jgi:hypothetical protein
VRTVRSLGTGGAADPLYEIADDYLAYWFAVLRDDADLIDGGQGTAVRKRTAGRWQTHVARVFEAAARSHAQRLVQRDELPGDTVIGRWWKDETVEIDVLGLSGDRPVLVGECRWQAKPPTRRDLGDLQRRAAHLPPPGDAGLAYAFWARGAGDELAGHPGVRTFTPADILAVIDS